MGKHTASIERTVVFKRVLDLVVHLREDGVQMACQLYEIEFTEPKEAETIRSFE